MTESRAIQQERAGNGQDVDCEKVNISSCASRMMPCGELIGGSGTYSSLPTFPFMPKEPITPDRPPPDEPDNSPVEEPARNNPQEDRPMRDPQQPDSDKPRTM